MESVKRKLGKRGEGVEGRKKIEFDVDILLVDLSIFLAAVSRS
jgi:hypothetical protein